MPVAYNCAADTLIPRREHGEGCYHMTEDDKTVPGRKADPQQVIQRYQDLRNLEKTGREFGITRERVRQIVNRAGISTARVIKPKVAKPERLCKECGAPVNSSHALYCETHRKEKHKRRYRAIKADPEKYAHWRELLKKYNKNRQKGHRLEAQRHPTGQS